MRRFAASLVMVAVMTGPAAAQQVVTARAGSEPVLRFGKTTLPRPFGATLVDRLSIVGTQRAGRSSYTLVRGDAAGPCPSHYVLVAREGRAEPRLTAPFGTCAGDARLTARRGIVEVAMAPGPRPEARVGTPVRFRLDGDAMRPVATTAAAAASDPSSCRIASDTDAATREAVLADFERSYPAAYRRASDLKRTDIAPEELRATVVGLACLATWPGADQVVPQAAIPLFASKRHGDAAFAALESVAQDPTSDANLRASVRAFAAEMTFRVERRDPL